MLVGLGGNVGMAGGEGEDIFGVTIGQDNVTRINDFQPDEDVIYIGSQPGMEVDVTVTPWANGTGASITVNDHVVAHVQGGQNLTAADIRVAHLGLEVELLGREG